MPDIHVGPMVLTPTLDDDIPKRSMRGRVANIRRIPQQPAQTFGQPVEN